MDINTLRYYKNAFSAKYYFSDNVAFLFVDHLRIFKSTKIKLKSEFEDNLEILDDKRIYYKEICIKGSS